MNLDKNTILQIFGSLMKNPLLLAEVDKYSLTPQDFSTNFEKYIFAAINNLYQNGAERISVVDIDNYLVSHEAVYGVFTENNGIEYLNDAEDLATLENFNYYYNKLKKYNAIRDLKLMGFNTNKIYPENILDEDREAKLDAFEKMSVQDIFNSVKADVAKAESKYAKKSNTQTVKANDGIRDLIKKLKTTPEIGVNCQGEIFNTVVRGARHGKFYIRSGGTGTGKTRSMVGDACYIAYPIRYNSKTEQWENTGSCERILYIGTEQKPEEIQTMIIAYLTDINEEKILYGNFNEKEEEILDKAMKLMDIYEDNFIISQIPDPSINEVKTHIRKHCLIEGIENVFYDYIFSSPGLLSEFRDLKVREDVVLMMLSTTLKDLAAELDVFIMSATQVNGELEDKKGIKNQTCLRGAKSIADKVDVGCITMKVTQDELTTLDVLIKKRGIKPNQVTDIYKVRRGRYNDVRIWSYMDLGTCRKQDLFITDANFKEIDGFQTIRILFDEDRIGEYDSILKLLNTGEVTEKLEEVLEEKELKIEELGTTDLKDIVPERSVFGGLLF